MTKQTSHRIRTQALVVFSELGGLIEEIILGLMVTFDNVLHPPGIFAQHSIYLMTCKDVYQPACEDVVCH